MFKEFLLETVLNARYNCNLPLNSLKSNIVFNRSNACVQRNGILLQNDLFLDQRVCLLLEEVALVDI